MFEIRELVSPGELEEGFRILTELRSDLDYSQFRGIYEAAKKTDGYQLWGVFPRGQVNPGSCIGVMGCRVLHDFAHGRHLYIDDLVVTASYRSKGIGSMLIQHAENLATHALCKGIRLCTGVTNSRGQRFYKREGLEPRAIAYKKVLHLS